MVLIRALTFMYVNTPKPNEVVDAVNSVTRELSNVGLTPWTVRVTISSGDVGDELFKWLCSSKYLFSIYQTSIEDLNYERLRNVMKCPNSFASIVLKDYSSVDSVVEVLINLVKTYGYDVATRLGFAIGDYVETPYYPLSTAFKDGVSVALRYVDTYASAITAENPEALVAFTLKKVSDFVSYSVKSAGLNYLGIDASISPWMNESVVPLIERVSGSKFPKSGSASGVRKLNNLIVKSVELASIPTLGFNEVMLPVGEDLTLMNLVRTGELQLNNLTFLTAYCLVGVDMVALPANKNLIKGVFNDVLAAYEVKKKPLGVRLIPVEESLQEVHIARFGSIPVIKS